MERFAERVGPIAMDMDLMTDMAMDAEREIREIAGGA